METQFNILKKIGNKELQNELDYERALIAERKLRILIKEQPKYKSLRKKLRDLIEKYEDKHWSSSSRISESKLNESDHATFIAENERIFIQKRKNLIKQKLKNAGLTQQDLGKILGHKSKTYMSELMNGISPFTINDLVIIHRLLKINLRYLVPTTLPQKEKIRIKYSLEKIGSTKIKLSSDDLDRSPA